MAEINFPNAVKNECDFFGRPEILSQIQHTLQSRDRRPIFVVGERQIGKTSLQNIAIQQVQSTAPAQFFAFHIEPRSISSFSQFTQAILRKLVSWVKATEGTELAALPTVAKMDDVEFEMALAGILGQRDQQILICIDEFDELVRKLTDELPLLFGTLYYLIEKTSLPLSFFFTMTRVPLEMKEEIPSTLVSLSDVFELHPLSLTEMSNMTRTVTAGSLEWNLETLQDLFRLSGGHPYFTKLLLTCLIETVHSAPESASNAWPVQVTPDLLAQAVRRAVHDPRSEYVLENLYRVQFAPDEKEILLALARHGGSIRLSDLGKAGKHWVTKARRLEKRHYLRINDQSGCVDFQIAFLGEWLRSWIEFDLECEKFNQLCKDMAHEEEELPVIEVDEAAGEVRVCGKPLKLSPQEFKIIRRLAQDNGRLVTREDLRLIAWETADGVTEQTIDTAFYRIRHKMGDWGYLIETNKAGRGFIMRRSVIRGRK